MKLENSVRSPFSVLAQLKVNAVWKRCIEMQSEPGSKNLSQRSSEGMDYTDKHSILQKAL